MGFEESFAGIKKILDNATDAGRLKGSINRTQNAILPAHHNTNFP